LRSFSIYIFKVLSLLVLLAYGLEPVLDYGLNSLEGSVYQEWDDLINGDINAELIVMGSSRGEVSYDPTIIEEQLGLSSYNLSFNAGSYNLQHAKLNAYLMDNKMPEVIIQNVDLTHFSKSDVIPFEQQFFTTINSLNILEIYKELPGTLKDFRFKGVSKYSIDNRRIKLSISNLLGLRPNYSMKQKGYNAVAKNYVPDTYNLSRLDNSGIDNRLRGLRKTLQYYQNERFEDTGIYFVWAPEYEIRRLLSNDIARALKETIKTQIGESKNIKFIDFREDEIGNDSNNFYDSFHLNATGSHIFTQTLISHFKTHEKYAF
jgi:hypothetical protein